MITAHVTGKLGQDPDLRTTRNGKSMVKFSVASSQKKGEEWQTTWIDVIAFDEQAEVAAEQLTKGTRVNVYGRMALEKYEKRDGSEGQSLSMIADDIGISMRFGTKDADAGKQSREQEASIPSGW